MRYGRHLWTIAYHVLSDREDSNECVNDSYYKAWLAIPPHCPISLSSFLGRIVRQLAIDRFRCRTAQKRAASEYTLSLDELAECVSGGDEPHESVELQLLARTVSDYLNTLSREARCAFLWRYYFMDPVREIAQRLDSSESQVKSMLYRVRLGLRTYLEREGITL